MVFACSGPGAGMAIASSIAIGYEHAGLLAACLLASLVVLPTGPKRLAIPALLLALLALHPAWTISAISGDCGDLKRFASWAFTGLGCVAFGWQVASFLRSRP